MIHIQNAATQMIDEFSKNGFNGVRFEDCRMEKCSLEDWIHDGEIEANYLDWIEGYACFILLPDIELPPKKTKYHVSRFDRSYLQDDLEAEMKRRFGDDVTINYRDGCNEYEIIRKGGE